MPNENGSPLLVDGELILYGYVGGDPEDYWFKGFNAQNVLQALAEVEGDITVRINSGGGSVFDGQAILNALKGYGGKVTVMVDAIAASAASVIMLAGDEIIVPASSLVMIHNSSGVTIGDAEDHAATASVLRKIDRQAAELYAERSGKTVEECVAAMDAETWFTGTEAVEWGLADSTGTANDNDDEADDSEATAAATFPYEIYARAPDALSGAASAVAMATREALASAGLRIPGQTRAAPRQKAAPAVPPKPEVKMTKKAAETPKAENTNESAAAAAKAAVAAERKRAKDIRHAVTAAGLKASVADQMIDDGVTADDARAKVIDMLAERDAAAPEISNQTRATVGEEAGEKFRQGVELSILNKLNLDGGERNEFSGHTLLEIARMSLEHNGVRGLRQMDRMKLAGVALNPMMAGHHSTDDFVEILGNVAERAMLRGYGEANESFDRFTARGTLGDFKVQTRVDIGMFPALSVVPEGGEYSYATVGERKAQLVLATYGKKFAITRQAIINDDLGLFDRLPRKMGRASRRTIGNLVWAVITSNPTMPDGTALFHADHGNLAGTAAAPTVASMDKAKAAMALQQDDDQHATALNIRPQYMLVPIALESTSNVLMAAEYDPSKTQRAPNPHRSTLEVISDGRLDANSATAWYLAANPNTTDTIEVSYLDGNDQPVLERRDGWNTDGVEMKVRIDAGVTAIDHRGLFKNAGA